MLKLIFVRPVLGLGNAEREASLFPGIRIFSTSVGVVTVRLNTENSRIAAQSTVDPVTVMRIYLKFPMTESFIKYPVAPSV